MNEQYSLWPLVPEMKCCRSMVVAMNIYIENWGGRGVNAGVWFVFSCCRYCWFGFFWQPLADDCAALWIIVSVLRYL